MKRLKELCKQLKRLNDRFYNEVEQYHIKKLGLNPSFPENTLGELCKLYPSLTCTKEELSMKPNELLTKKHIKKQFGGLINFVE